MSILSTSRPTVANIYNPQNQTKEQLIEGFVVRQQLFKKLFKAIKEAKMEVPEQHYLLLGRRGMGKTTLLLRLAYEIQNDPELSTWLIPLVFNEEEYGVRSLFKLWERVMELLEEKHPAFRFETEALRQLSKQHPKHDDYEKALFDWLSGELKRNGKKLILFIDNFGDMARKLTDAEAHRLRKILQTSADLRVFAASSVVLEAFYRYDHAFYEFFKQAELKGLDEKETRELLLSLSQHYKKEDVARILEQNPGRVEALRRITGGVTRSVVLLFEIFADDSDGGAFHDLQVILDRTSPLYKHRMDDLSDQQQAIVEAIALNWDAISVKEIAEQTRLDSKLISAQLSSLEKNGIVEKRATRTKNHLYLVSERFFNIWFLMRLGRKADQKRVLWLVRFFEDWCDKDLMKSRAERHIDALRKGGFYPESAYYITQALAATKSIDPISRHRLLAESKTYLSGTDTELAQSLSRSDLDIAVEVIEKWYAGEKAAAIQVLRSARPFEKGKMSELLKNAPEAIDFQHLDASEEARWEEAMGDFACDVGWMFYDDLEDKQVGWQCIERCAEFGFPRGMLGLGWIYRYEHKDLAKAEEWYLKAAEKGNATAMNNLGLIYQIEHKDLAKAEEWYLKAAEKGDSDAMYNLGGLYWGEHKDLAKAEEWYLKVAEKGDSDAMYNLGGLYWGEHKDLAKAEEWYFKAVEKGGTDAMNDLAWLFFEQKKEKEKALELAANAHQKEPGESNIAHTYASILLWNSQTEKAFEFAHLFVWDEELQADDKEGCLLFFTLALAKNQAQKLYELFTSPQGQEQHFKDRYKPIWYAILKKLDHPDFLRIGDELSQTVEEILAAAEQMAIDYQ
jgi:TPR repeat protein